MRRAPRPARSPAPPCLLSLLIGLAVASCIGEAHAADCNGNGVADDVDIASGASRDCDENGVPDDCEGVPLIVGSVVRHALSGAAGQAAVGDLDGDGRLEIAVATLEPGELGFAVFLDPTSGAAGAATSLASPIVGFECGDLDGDGDLDLALARARDIRTFLNAGDGTFPARSYVSQTGSFAAVRIGDFDGDRVNDVVASRADRGAVAVFRGVGAGQFGTPVEVTVASPGALSLVDADGDGDLDVVILEGGGTLAVLQNLGGASLAAPAPVSAAGTGIQAFSAGDLDGDGLQDIAAISASRLVVLSNRGGGSFELRATFVVSDGATLRAVAIGDPDGDGLSEIVLGRSGPSATEALQLIRPIPGGGLEPSMPVSVASRPGSIRLVDLDNDGTDELVVPAAAAPEVTIIRRHGDQSSQPSNLAFRTTTHSLAAFGRFEPHASLLADLDRDGWLDLATMDGEYRVMILRNQGDGTQGDETIYNVRDADELISIAPADLDRDGDIDIAAVDEGPDLLFILLNRGDGTFAQTATSYSTDARPYVVVPVDLDGDGDLDLVSANEQGGTIGIFRNRGDATFDDQRSLAVGTGPVGLAAADFDGDGHPDLAVGQTGSARVTIFRNDGNGNLVDRVDHAAGKVSCLSGADLDADGDVDLVAARESENRVTILRNAGGGAFELAETFDIGQPPRSVIAPDLNGDGLPDLVTGNEDTNTISILLNLGGGEFGQLARHSVGQAPRFVVSGDLDRDGDTDLVVANHTSLDLTFFFNETPASPAAGSPLGRICTELQYAQLAKPVAAGGVAELDVRYLAPARPGDSQLLPTVFLPTAGGREIWQTLAALFPERFDGLTEEGYLDLVARRATRQYFEGSVLRLQFADRVIYGFTITTDAAANPGERVTASEAAGVDRALEAAFLLEPLAYYPDTPEARADARAWGDPGFPLLILEPPLPFRRGDAQADGVVNVADAIAVLGYLFRGGKPVPCLDAADANDDGEVDISDAAMLLRHLFGSQGNLPAPSGACGLDRTDDDLSCGAFSPCP